MENTQKERKYAECPMCHSDRMKFFVITFDDVDRMRDYNTQLECEYCGYEVPLELVDFIKA
jgi:DNA-directed RNA polymerase subunit RPC12/RpoP